MDTNPDYLAGMRSHFKQWDEAVTVLQAEGKKADGVARTAYERRLKELRLARNAAQRSLDAFRTASPAAATQSEAGLKAAWETMQKALDHVSKDLHAPEKSIAAAAPAAPEATEAATDVEPPTPLLVP